MTLQAESAVEKKDWLAAILSATYDLIEMKPLIESTQPRRCSLSHKRMRKY